MKKATLILMVLFCFSYTGYRLFFHLDSESEKKAIALNNKVTRLSPDELSLLREGDFILRRGFGFFSDYIATKLNTGSIDVTHAGIIVKHNRRLYVIHSLSSDVSSVDGVQMQTLEDFLTHSAPGKIIVTRAKDTDAAFGKKVAQQAKFYLGRKIPFDHNGRYDDTAEFFCTELIWQILEKDLHHSLLPQTAEGRKTFFYTMVPMYSADYFDIIINQYSSAKY